MSSFPPGIILLVGALLLPGLPRAMQSKGALLLPALSLGTCFFSPKGCSLRSR